MHYFYPCFIEDEFESFSLPKNRKRKLNFEGKKKKKLAQVTLTNKESKVGFEPRQYDSRVFVPSNMFSCFLR